MPPNKIAQFVGAIVMIVSAAAVFVLLIYNAIYNSSLTNTLAAVAFGVIIFGVTFAMVTGQELGWLKFGVSNNNVEFGFRPRSPAELVQPRKLDEKTIVKKVAFAKEVQQVHSLPGQDAPEYKAITPSRTPSSPDDFQARPSAYPTTPMYLLDSAFRIIDWNQAFTIAFDRTMEGRKGRGVLEWTYFLDNYEEVLSRGVIRFGDANKLPFIDVEEINYTSQRYGPLSATKRAYQIPDDESACMGWLVTLDLRFSDQRRQTAFHQDLLRVLAMDLIWSEYALSYDRVLNNTKVYPKLIDKIIGGYNGVRAIPQDARIIDLGAGTGNVTYKLITTGLDRVIFAAENNRFMLECLKAKCKRYLRSDAESGGVIADKRDITSLFGLEDSYFDFALLNNVLYSVHDVDSCLKEALRVLKPSGELRLSGPRKNTELKVLFYQIMKELKESGKFQELETDYKHVREINEWRLSQWLYQWSTKDVEQMLLNAGFSEIVYSSEDVYAGQSMLICAVK